MQRRADDVTRSVALATGVGRRIGIGANVVNPGAVDTGWMDDEVYTAVLATTPGGRRGRSTDVANLVSPVPTARSQV